MMTVFLQPGDVIHLAVPLYPPPMTYQTPEAQLEYATEQAAPLVAWYESQGVTVGRWSSSTRLDAPQIVAVFRKGCCSENARVADLAQVVD